MSGRPITVIGRPMAGAMRIANSKLPRCALRPTTPWPFASAASMCSRPSTSTRSISSRAPQLAARATSIICHASCT